MKSLQTFTNYYIHFYFYQYQKRQFPILSIIRGWGAKTTEQKWLESLWKTWFKVS